MSLPETRPTHGLSRMDLMNNLFSWGCKSPFKRSMSVAAGDDEHVREKHLVLHVAVCSRRGTLLAGWTISYVGTTSVCSSSVSCSVEVHERHAPPGAWIQDQNFRGRDRSAARAGSQQRRGR
jgi:hypothetical protein